MIWPFNKKPPRIEADPEAVRDVVRYVTAKGLREQWIRENAMRLLLDRDGFTWENALVAARRIYDGAIEAKSEAKT